MSDPQGRVVVLTGASAGIGEAAAIELAARGARVVAVGRDPQRLKAIGERVGVEGLRADFASLSQVRGLAGELLERHEHIHALVNNAGLIADRRRLTEDGHEMTFAVNHLAPFLLTNLLLDRLRASGPARVVTTSSDAHHRGRLDFEDLGGEGSWSSWGAYANSKLANILFTRALAGRLDPAQVTANCLHPGVIRTRLGQGAGGALGAGWSLARPFFSSRRRGAETIVHLVASPEGASVTGAYYARSRPAGTSAAAADYETAERLWKASRELVGLDD
ncbi:MAG: SDR family NAD(P)-dependent oxidoreductase [Actinomycetota bacterium]|nr:SDR family NAD(P)-dependent oxidoreductase [Actinomycetota bacterium]